MKRVTIITLVCVLALAVEAWAVTIEPVKVLGGPGEQYGGWQDAEHLAYALDAKDNGNAHAFVRVLATDETIRLDAPRSQGTPGGMDPLAPHDVIYTQYPGGDDSDIYVYDLDAGERHKVPGVNTRDWEYSPRISASYILFARDRYIRGKWYVDVLLHDRGTNHTSRLTRYSWSNTTVFVSGTVGDRFASWTRCGDETCTAYIYDSLATHYRIGKLQYDGPNTYAPAVDEASGMIYFVRGGRGCGRDVMFKRRPVADLVNPATKLAELPDGIDAGWATIPWVDTDAGVLNINFERWDCRRETGDIYTLPAVDTVP